MKPRAWACFDATRRFAVACTFVASLAMLAFFASASTAVESSSIAAGEILVGDDSAVPPPDSAAWQAVSLPDLWWVSRPGIRGYAWYRFHFDLPVLPKGRQALFFPRLRTVGAAFVNGREVGQSGEFGVATAGLRPQLYEFSPGLMQAGRNTVHVRLWIAPGYAGVLEPVRVGPGNLMAAEFDRHRFLRVTLAQFVVLVGAVLGAMMGAIWLGRRHDTMFGWFALAALSKAFYVSFLVGAFPAWRSSAVLALLVVPMLVPLSIYCLRYAGWHWPRFERVLWGVGIIYALHHAARFFWGSGLPSPFSQSVNLFLLGAPAVLALVILYRRPGAESGLLVIAHLLSFGMMWHEIFGRSIPPIHFEATHTLPLFLVMAWILTRRFVRVLNEAEALNAHLERRVAEKHAELEREAARTQHLVRDAAVAAERQRMTGDMHDGLGSQLISTLEMVEAGEAPKQQIAAALRECIDDLRLAIDSLEPSDKDLLPVLGNLRYRLEPRLKARGIALDWHVEDVPKLAYLTPQNVLHVLRIMQEAFTNVLKHAGASRIRVATRTETGRVLIDVSDDGIGMTAAAPGPRSHGLANMRRRTEALGGELRVTPSGHGTTVTLSLPVVAVATV
jgi:signal transduction histidine kinase